jgi:ubiquinone/menaquinone biosynthesis C-methylase UbiE
MTVLDLGCGPGLFSLDMAQMVGPSGRVIAADLQEGMLQKLSDKIRGTDLEGRITLHKCEEGKIGVTDQLDFVLLFYVVHEVPDKEALFKEISSLLNPDGLVLMVEPPFHVSKAAFAETISIARGSGFTDSKGPKVLFSKSVILRASP